MLTPTMDRMPQKVFTWAFHKKIWLHRRLRQSIPR
jgi:hypothetical protein